MVAGRQAHALDRAAQLLHQHQRALHRVADAGLDALPHQLVDDAHAQAAEVGGLGDRDGLRPFQRGRVHGVVSDEVGQQERRVAHRAGERADLVQRRGERDEAVARHRAVGGLHAHDAAERGRLADGAAGVAAQSERRLVGRHRGRRSAARSPGHPVGVPGVAGHLVGGVLGARPHGELVHVGLPHHDRPGALEALHAGGGVERAEALQDPRPGRRGEVAGGEGVLDRDRQSGRGAGAASIASISRARERARSASTARKEPQRSSSTRARAASTSSRELTRPACSARAPSSAVSS